MCGNRECVCECDHRDRKKERERERGKRKWDRQQRYKLLTPSSPLLLHPPLVLLSLLPLRGSEGGHPLLQALNQPAGDLARPGYSARSLFVCLLRCHPAAISLQPVPGYTATSAEVPFHQMSIILPALCQDAMADSSVLRQCNVLREVFDRDHDKTCPG